MSQEMSDERKRKLVLLRSTFLCGLGVKGDGTSWSLGVLVAISTTVSVFVHLVGS